MKKTVQLHMLIILTFLSTSIKSLSQNCSVLLDSINETYVGDCKNGKADGKGEAKGFYKYKGEFKEGMPDGKGTYFYNEANFFVGNFLNGLKEGEGEWHQEINGKDSVTKGFWSGNTYIGNLYTPYKFTTEGVFDKTNVRYSKNIGNSVSFGISVTPAIPNFPIPIRSNEVGNTVVKIRNVFTEDGQEIPVNWERTENNTYCAVYILPKFPIKLFGYLDDGGRFDVEFTRSAEWHIGMCLIR